MTCAWCKGPIPGEARADARFCSQKCRQAAWRSRAYSSRLEDRRLAPELPLRFAYADPPYPGTARRYYSKEETYAGEIDHAALIHQLENGRFAGWALSTSARALRNVLPLCPADVRVCAWVKPGGAPPATAGLHNVWEPLIVLEGRRIRPGKRDALYVHAARFGGSLPGRKPLKFCAWLFAALGMRPGDELVDLFPGTGIVSRAWAEISKGSVASRSSATARGVAQ